VEAGSMKSSIQRGEQGLAASDQSDAGMIADEYMQDNPLPEEINSLQNEETVSISTRSADINSRPVEDVDSNSADAEDSIPVRAEEIVYLPNIPEESNSQPANETGSDSISLEDFMTQYGEENDLISNSPEDNNPQLEEETGTISTSLEDTSPLPTEEIEYVTPPQEIVSVAITQEIVNEPASRKIALILSGGGARGAFQVGAEKYAREVKGYHWDIIAGVSVGAMNGAMLAMHRFTRLMELWDSISGSQVYTGGFNLVSLVKLMFGAKSFYGNAPLQKLMQHEFEAGRVIDDLHVGAVSLISGEYVQFTKESLELAKAILASASIPVVWPPVDISPDRTAMVDGGVRNISPVGDVLELEPDEIMIINCSAEQPTVAPQALANVLTIGIRALDIMQNEIFVNDMKEFLRINALVKEAEKQGCLLHHPKTGKLLKYYPCHVIEPDSELGEVLDFSQASIQAALRAGVRRAREVLGRP
jgi:NTE family protein